LKGLRNAWFLVADSQFFCTQVPHLSLQTLPPLLFALRHRGTKKGHKHAGLPERTKDLLTALKPVNPGGSASGAILGRKTLQTFPTPRETISPQNLRCQGFLFGAIVRTCWDLKWPKEQPIYADRPG